MTAERGRIDQLDGLRALAFLSVFSFHALHLPFGYLGVDLFFVLSGFLITRNLLALRERATVGSSFRVFFYRRLLRIVPPYYLALVVMAVVAPFPASEMPWYFGFASNIRDALYPVLEGPMVTMWSIAVEEQFYLLWPFLVLLVPRRYLVGSFVAAIVVATVFRGVVHANDDAVYRLMPSRMDLLAIGALLAAMEAREAGWIARRQVWFAAAGAGALAVFAVMCATIPSFHFRNQDALYSVVGYGLCAVIFGAVIALVSATTSATVRAVLCNPVMRFAGKVSYMAYLCHVVALDLVRRLELRGPVTIALVLALTFGFSALSWYAMEQPLQRLRDVVRVKARSG